LPPRAWKIRSGQVEVIAGAPIRANAKLDKRAARQDLLARVTTVMDAQLAPGATRAPSLPPTVPAAGIGGV
jgi:hypothetical protein